MGRPIRNSAKALIIKDGKMATVKLRDESGVFYIMPGGGQESEELLPDCVKREVAEELGIEINPKELVFVIEGAHGEDFHRVDLVFLCEYIKEIGNAELHSDQNQIGYDWLDIETLLAQPLYPSKLRRQIMKLYHGEKCQTYLGNEEAGDSETFDLSLGGKQNDSR
jgi:8-oxo-dGTP pyrophosphatase MutT (NUDIX family)